MAVLVKAARRRHLAGGLSGHSEGCEIDLVHRVCRCGSIELLDAFRFAQQALPPSVLRMITDVEDASCRAVVSGILPKKAGK